MDKSIFFVIEEKVMSGRLVPDELWAEVGSLILDLESTQSGKGRRPAVDKRTIFTCIVFMLRTGIANRVQPTEIGASEKSVRRRSHQWTQQGIWTTIFHPLLVRLRAAGRLDLVQVPVKGGLLKALFGGETSVPSQQIANGVGVS